jgi:hypothetical protein
VSAEDPIVPRDPAMAGDEDVLTPDQHLGWRLSALLDGELPVAEELMARQHLAGCDRCQEEFVEVTSARALVRGLGEVEPPQGYTDRVVRRVQRRSQQRLGLLGLLGLAVVWVLVLLIGAGAEAPAVAPDLDAFVRNHRDAASAGEVEGGRSVDADALDPPFVFLPRLGVDLDRRSVVELSSDTVQGHYGGPGGAVSIFQQEGRLVEDDLPVGSVTGEIGGWRVWSVPVGAAGTGGHVVVVVEQGPMVVTLVGSGPTEKMHDLITQLPEPQSYRFRDWFRQSLEGFARRLGLGG